MIQKYGLILIIFFVQCKVEEKADSIFFNGKIYTADSKDAVVQALAVKNGQILAIGTDQDILKFKSDNTQMNDLDGQFVMPGLIEGHGHFLSLGKSVLNLNLLQTKNWDEITQKVAEKLKTIPPGEWLEGMGWHQEKWNKNPGLTVNGYPFHDDLSKISPDNPVILQHASGHALIANQKAMELASINSETNSPAGGRIVKDASGKLTGVFEENAMNLIFNAFQQSLQQKTKSQQLDLLKLKAFHANTLCNQFGITSFQDAGSSLEEIRALKSLCDSQQLSIRLYVMLLNDTDSTLSELDQLPIPMNQNQTFSCKAVKAYLDGALGSYGAWLLAPYADKSDFYGQNTLPISKLQQIATACKRKGLQLCVHGIGDRGNREILNVFENQLKSSNFDQRWRIEHAQHLDTLDIPRFKALGVIASMQAIHCTSDAPFVIKRLGFGRARQGAYAWRSLLNAGTHLANGTDCPVESVNPFECMYAAITRKRLDSGLEFFPEQKMSRIEALRSYTIWNAYAAFEESIKGSLEVGKIADFIILDRNLLECNDSEVAGCKVTKLIFGGKERTIN